MSKVQDCRLTSVGELPFNFFGGGCNTFSVGIMLCFDYFAQQECHSWVRIHTMYYIVNWPQQNIFLVLMEKPSKQKHHQNSLMRMSLCLDLIGTHHLLPDTIQELMDWRQKFLIMGWETGNKLLTTHFLMVIGMYRKVLWKEIKIFINEDEEKMSLCLSDFS